MTTTKDISWTGLTPTMRQACSVQGTHILQVSTAINDLFEHASVADPVEHKAITANLRYLGEETKLRNGEPGIYPAVRHIILY